MHFGFRLNHVPITLLPSALWFQSLVWVSRSADLIAVSDFKPKALFILTVQLKHGDAKLVL